MIAEATHAEHDAQKARVLASLSLSPKRCDRQFEASGRKAKGTV